MSLCLNSLVIRRLAKLPVGVPVSVPIGGVLTPTTNVRFATKMSRAEVKAIRERARQAAKGTVIPKGTHPFPPGHGDRVYVFHHFLDGITVYSNTPVLKATNALRQIPFFGKKLKPSKMRRDYWRPLAMIELPEGYGEVGRSLYARLRECKSLRELAWGDEMYHDDATGRILSREGRGKKILNQKPYIIADIAAVLGGIGKSNKIRPKYIISEEADSDGNEVATPNPPTIPEPAEPLPPAPPDEVVEDPEDDAKTSSREEQDVKAAEEESKLAAEEPKDGGETSALEEQDAEGTEESKDDAETSAVEEQEVKEEAEEESEPVVAIAKTGTKGDTARESDVVDGLIRTTVHWVNELDKNYARNWTSNVTHVTLHEGKWPAPLTAPVAHAVSENTPDPPVPETPAVEEEPTQESKQESKQESPKQESPKQEPPKQESSPQAP